jgi:hypothetical protein
MAILEVLAILIEESEDITQPFLDLILSNLFPPMKVRALGLLESPFHVVRLRLSNPMPSAYSSGVYESHWESGT